MNIQHEFILSDETVIRKGTRVLFLSGSNKSICIREGIFDSVRNGRVYITDIPNGTKWEWKDINGKEKYVDTGIPDTTTSLLYKNRVYPYDAPMSNLIKLGYI